MSGEVAKRAPASVLDPVHGELVPLDSTPTRLAELLDNLRDFRGQIGDQEALVSDELVARMDAEANWTLHLEGFKVTAPSPSAGTEEWPEADLEVALDGFVRDGTLAPAAASAALQRRLTIVVDVPWGHDPDKLAEAVKGAVEVNVAGVQVTVVSVEPSRKTLKAGVARLLKLPAVAPAVASVRQTVDAGRRKAKVERS